jgi:hypothetical protein
MKSSMIDVAPKSKRGRPSGSIKRSLESRLELCHHIEYVQMVESRRTGRKPSISEICKRLELQGGWHEIDVCDRDHRHRFPITRDVRRGFVNDTRTGIRISPDGDLFLEGTIQHADSLRRRYYDGIKYIKVNGLEEMMDSRLLDALGEPRQASGWAMGWRPPFAYQPGV